MPVKKNRLEELLARDKAKEEKKKAKEEKKEAIRKEKKEKKRVERKKRLLKKTKHRYYMKKRNEVLKEKEKQGDRYGYFSIIITKNRVKHKALRRCFWYLDAMAQFNEFIEENRKMTMCPKKVVSATESLCDGSETIGYLLPVEYEILLIEKKTDEDEKVTMLQNEDGKFVTNKVVTGDYKVVAKDKWFVEEEFTVTGYLQKKTCQFILFNILLEGLGFTTVKNVFTYQKYLVIQDAGEFTAVLCRTKGEAKRLEDVLENESMKRDMNQFIIFNNKLSFWPKKDFLQLWKDNLDRDLPERMVFKDFNKLVKKYNEKVKKQKLSAQSESQVS